MKNLKSVMLLVFLFASQSVFAACSVKNKSTEQILNCIILENSDSAHADDDCADGSVPELAASDKRRRRIR